MTIDRSQSASDKTGAALHRFFDFLIRRAFTVIIVAALIYTLAVKLFHACRTNLTAQYFTWIPADIAALLAVELVLTLICFRWPRKTVIRTVTILAALVCTWSVMNAGWLIRSGWQILPRVILPLFRAPINSFGCVGVNFACQPITTAILLVPSAVLLTFFFFSLAKPLLPNYSRKRLVKKTRISLIIILIAVIAQAATASRGSIPTASLGLRSNCQLRAVLSLFFTNPRRLPGAGAANPTRKIPAFDEIHIDLPPKSAKTTFNVLIVVLEGIQYRYTSLADRKNHLTPHLAALADQGVQFTNMRSTVTHTTKALFSILTGRYPSASQDLAEAVPAAKPYAGLATILKHSLNFRTAFFQSAKGNFEARPALVHNLGFDKFWARDDSNDPNSFVGYLGSDEFEMLQPITDWIKTDDRPFFLVILCSVSHDPYEVPERFGPPAKQPIQRYRQTIRYTDAFLAALDARLNHLNLADKTIFCCLSDHGEAFGEHGLFGHERIAFDEALRIPCVIRAPSLLKPKTTITKPVSATDLPPTLLTLLGFDTKNADFDGTNALGRIATDRKVYFAGWMQHGPAGFVRNNQKFVYYPARKAVYMYDLATDPGESARIELTDQQACTIADQITAWRNRTIFRLDQQRSGKKILFDKWLCRWTNRVASAKYRPQSNN